MASQLAMKTAIQEISKGEELMASLHSHLQYYHSTKASDLSTGILASLRSALSILKPKENHNTNNAHKRKRRQQKPTHVSNEHKRRKFSNSKAIFTPVPHMDGHQWRKYGQKKIQNYNNPRNYYRCTYRDKGCLAIKLVQEEETCDDLPMFRVIYVNQHTCNNTALENTSHLSLGSSPQSTFFVVESKNSCEGFSNGEQLITISPKHEDCCGDDYSLIINSPVLNMEKAKIEEDIATIVDFPMNPTSLWESYGLDFEDDHYSLITSYQI